MTFLSAGAFDRYGLDCTPMPLLVEEMFRFRLAPYDVWGFCLEKVGWLEMRGSIKL